MAERRKVAKKRAEDSGNVHIYLRFDRCDAEVGQMMMKDATVQWLDDLLRRAELKDVPPLRGDEELDAVSGL